MVLSIQPIPLTYVNVSEATDDDRVIVRLSDGTEYWFMPYSAKFGLFHQTSKYLVVDIKRTRRTILDKDILWSHNSSDGMSVEEYLEGVKIFLGNTLASFDWALSQGDYRRKYDDFGGTVTIGEPLALGWSFFGTSKYPRPSNHSAHHTTVALVSGIEIVTI